MSRGNVTKIAKGERRGKRKTQFLKFDYAELPPILFKDNENADNIVL